ncbi:hypothetical protein L6R52_41975, partial [Myxococcota bacterium]|nr:hypothetical protein [Myxococcota bacterium]
DARPERGATTAEGSSAAEGAERAAAAVSAAGADVAKPTDAAEVPSEWRVLPVDSALRAKADPTAPKLVKLPAETKILVYPTFPAPEGWMLATGPDGEIGYLKRGVFSATPAPAAPKKVTTKAAATKPKAPAKKSSKVDPFELLERPRSR